MLVAVIFVPALVTVAEFEAFAERLVDPYEVNKVQI